MKENKLILLIDSLALFAIGIVSFGYVLFQARFAEIHVQFSFLDFPIFVGEWLTFVCLVLFLWKICLVKPAVKWWHIGIAAYFVFVVAKALCGYFKWGPLAFRNAAMFYYLLFISFGYFFYNRRIMLRKERIGIILLFAWMYVCIDFNHYWTLSCLLLSFVLLKGYKNRIVQLVFLSIVLITTPFNRVIDTTRSLILGNLLAFGYLCLVGCYFLPGKKIVKLATALVGVGLACFAFYNFANTARIQSMLDIQRVRMYIHGYNERILEKIDTYQMKDFGKVQIYNPDVKLSKSSGIKENNKPKHPEQMNQDVIVEALKKEIIKSKQHYDLINRDYDDSLTVGEVNNAVFRLLVWRDMYVEYKYYKPWIGFDFGKPVRSISIEVLQWAKREWQRDGWVAVHNSFIHILFRSGIIGIVLILTIITVWIRMAFSFAVHKSMKGILLCAIILSWFIAANFLLIFEFPYTAIPIWMLFGMTFAYYKEQINLKEDLNYELEK